MTEEQPRLTRRVVTGVDSSGRSIIVTDDEIVTWVRRPTGALIMDIWRVDALPPNVDYHPQEGADLVLLPDPGGVVVRVAVFPPDSNIDESGSSEYEASMQAIYGDQDAAAPSAIPGMHSTETIDVVTVVNGEIWVVMEEGETCLRAGDSLVQRGTRHAWQNRSDRPCTLSTVMMPAIRNR